MTTVMQSAGDTNWYKIKLTAGDTYSFKESGLSQATLIEVIPTADAADFSHMVEPYDESAATAVANFTADASGYYYVQVTDLFGRTGDYTLTASQVTNSYTLAHPGALAVGATGSEKMQNAGDTNWFKITLAAGHTYSFKETGLSAATVIDIVPAADAADASHEVIQTKDSASSSLANFTADTTGAYYVEISDVNGRTGNYTLNASQVTDSYTLAHPGALTVGVTGKEKMQSAGDANWFKITLAAGDTYAFTEAGLSGGTAIDIVAASDAADASHMVASGGTAGTSIANFTADKTGVYYVEVIDDLGLTGDYTLGASQVQDTYTLAHPGLLKIGATGKEDMQSAGDTDWIRVALTAGDTYSFKETGLSAATNLDIVSASGAADASHMVTPTSFSGATATANFTADASGYYYVEVTDSLGVTGGYTLGATEVQDTYTLAHPGALKVGATGKEDMQSAGDTDWFKVELTAGDTYSVKETGLSAATTLDMISASGAADTSHMFSTGTTTHTTATANFTADTSGAYYIEVTDGLGVTGAYTLGVSQVANGYTLGHPGTLTA